MNRRKCANAYASIGLAKAGANMQIRKCGSEFSSKKYTKSINTFTSPERRFIRAGIAIMIKNSAVMDFLNRTAIPIVQLPLRYPQPLKGPYLQQKYSLLSQALFF